jgi:uncharacterized protein YehS (DUF1456 family)
MLTEKGRLEVQMKKLTGICDEHNLVWSFKKDTYPIALVIKATSSMEGQMSLLADDDTNNHVSKDAKLIFSFKDGSLDICIKDGTFRVSKALISKLENIFIRMHGFWLQYFHREMILNDVVKAEEMPEVDEDVGDSDISTRRLMISVRIWRVLRQTERTMIMSTTSQMKRDDYRAVKKMNREQLSDYLNRVFMRGYKKGQEGAGMAFSPKKTETPDIPAE